ncbi:hypothetical protein ATSB10_10500 [Dyella thiooxydans]|uniref:Uncharacterized protein n=1 Tax=Dyella thiooxydans TaxID=445710 RepID=A0A160MZD9_9GAMM|nr:hypothetical protein ATSB10_10500 [Dyella thiooxydans]
MRRGSRVGHGSSRSSEEAAQGYADRSVVAGWKMNGVAAGATARYQ